MNFNFSEMIGSPFFIGIALVIGLLLRWRFKSKRKQAWEHFSQFFGGEFHKGGLFRSPAVEAMLGKWRVRLDTYSEGSGSGGRITYTRVRAHFVTTRGFKFSIRPARVFHNIGTMFGMQDIEIGISEFDKKFIIKGSHPDRIRELIENPEVRYLIESQSLLLFEVKDHDESWLVQAPNGFDPYGNTPMRVADLYFRAMGTINDIERLRSIFDLFQRTLEHLDKTGTTEPVTSVVGR